jgi:hypothetical protein
MSTTEIDGLNLFFIYSELSELAPRIHCCETTLQRSAARAICKEGQRLTSPLGGIIYIKFAQGGGQGGKFGTTACAFQERFNFPFQIK